MKPVVTAYYYPGYHETTERNIRGQKTEWALLDDQIARHAYQDVRRPMAGPVLTTPATLEQEIALAHASGIDAFMWCWYWDRGRLHLNAPLDMLQGRSAHRDFRYALLWANKRPHFELPLNLESAKQNHRSRLIETDEADWIAMHQHLIAQHWQRNDYLKFDGKPLFQIFLVEPLIRSLGPDRLKRMLQTGQELAQNAGLPGVCYVALMHRLNSSKQWLSKIGLGRLAGDAPLASMGFDAVSSYVLLPDWDGKPLQDYAESITQRTNDWPRFARRFGLPYWPALSPGWDARVRGEPISPEPTIHPWAPRVIGESPALFARWLDDWRQYAATRNVPVLPLTSWNEWTEGHAIAPCDRHGDGFLGALRSFTDSLQRDTQSPPAGVSEHDSPQV